MTTLTPIRPEESSDSAPPLRKRSRRGLDGDACLDEGANVDQEMAEHEDFLFGPSGDEQDAGTGGPGAPERAQALEREGRGGPGPLGPGGNVPEAQESVETPEIHIALERTQGEYLEP